MSFKFNWQFFDVADLKARGQEALTASIAQTRRPPSIVAPIRVINIEFGSEPPRLKFKSIQAVSLSGTHIVFALKYTGDASLTLVTEIQANVLNEHLDDPNFPEFVKPKVIGAHYGLALPFMLKIKSIVLDALIDVVYTPSGVIVNFNEDPLKSLDAESSLDSFPFVHTMIRKLLKDQLTVSFYEDIPESIWASSNPAKQHPEPFYGARRWSRHSTVFAKAASFLYTSFGPKSRAPFTPFQTLALNTQYPSLAQPRAILSRGALWRYANLRDLQEKSGEAQLLKSEKMNRFLIESSSVSIASSSSTAAYTTNSARNTKPKRRVISLRKMSKALAPSASPSAPSSPFVSPSREDTASHNHSYNHGHGHDHGHDHNRHYSAIENGGQSPKPPRKVSSRSPSDGEQWDATTIIKSSPTRAATTSSSSVSSRHSSPKTAHTPLFKPSEFSAIAEDETPYLEEPDGALLPPVINWDHRRFSSPEKTEPIIRKRGAPRQRTTSLLPLGNQSSAAQTSSNTAPGMGRPRSPMSRSPRRYSSTNDLMNK